MEHNPTVVAGNPATKQTVLTRGKVMATVPTSDPTLVRLDFGDGKYVDIPPEVAQSLVSDQATRDNIKVAIRRCHQSRVKLHAETNSGKTYMTITQEVVRV